MVKYRIVYMILLANARGRCEALRHLRLQTHESVVETEEVDDEHLAVWLQGAREVHDGHLLGVRRIFQPVQCGEAREVAQRPCHTSPSHRRGTLKGVPTVKSQKSHQQIT